MKTKPSNTCNHSCAVKLKPTARIMAIIESKFRHLEDYKNSRSLLKKYLTKELFNVIKNRVTPFGSTLLDVIHSGIENIESKVGAYAPDGTAYKVYYELFDQIIEDYHCNVQHPIVDFGFVEKIINVDYEKNYMLSVKISCNRSLCGYPFNRRLSEDQFRQIEMRVSQDLLRFGQDFKGTYTSLIDTNKEQQKQLLERNYLFHNRNDTFLNEAIGNRCWPIGRGVFCNAARNFFVWINIEDHLSVISVENGADFGRCYRRLVAGLKKIGSSVGFLRDKRLGYLNFCPTNLGTGMEISAQMKLYKLPKNERIFKEIATRYNLCIDAACTDKCATFICTFVFKPKLGMNEFETVQWMQNALLDIIRAEIHL